MNPLSQPLVQMIEIVTQYYDGIGNLSGAEIAGRLDTAQAALSAANAAPSEAWYPTRDAVEERVRVDMRAVHGYTESVIHHAVDLVREHDAKSAAIDPEGAAIPDYQAALDSVDLLVRRLDVLINGKDGAARQARLADLIGQIEREGLVSKWKADRDAAKPDSGQVVAWQCRLPEYKIDHWEPCSEEFALEFAAADGYETRALTVRQTVPDDVVCAINWLPDWTAEGSQQRAYAVRIRDWLRYLKGQV